MRLVDRLRAALRGLFEGLTSTDFYWIVMIAGGLEELANIFTEYGHGIFLVCLSGGTLMILLGALFYYIPWPSYRMKNWAGGLLIAGVGMIAFACLAGVVAWAGAYFPSKAVGIEPPVRMPSNPWEPPRAS